MNVKKLLSLLLVIIITTGALPLGAYAEGDKSVPVYDAVIGYGHSHDNNYIQLDSGSTGKALSSGALSAYSIGAGKEGYSADELNLLSGYLQSAKTPLLVVSGISLEKAGANAAVLVDLLSLYPDCVLVAPGESCSIITSGGGVTLYGYIHAEIGFTYVNLAHCHTLCVKTVNGAPELSFAHDHGCEHGNDTDYTEISLTEIRYMTGEGEPCAHEYTSEVTTEATCTLDGIRTYTCTLCGNFYTEEIPATGHTWGNWTVVTAPTCTEKGLDERFCSVCSEHETRETDMTGHTWGEWTVVTAPTCTAKGLDERFCSVCSEHETRETDALEHDYVAVVTDPTCTEQGYTTHTCSRCGDTYIDTYVDATGHTWGEWTVVTAPTCTAKGLDERFCSVCSVRETRETDALEHDYVAVVTDPTCTEQGYTTHTCSRCNDSYIDTYVDATGHAWGEWTVVTAPTCTEKGLDERFCSVCSVRETRETDALEHDYVAVVTDPTCTEQGYTTHTCSRCNDSYIDTYVDATGHAWGEWTVVTAPTCTEKGLDERFCSVCSERETRETDAPGHTWGEWTVVTAPTCTAKGLDERFCSVCSVRETRETDALEHDYVAVVTDPTCTEQGYTTHTCSRCNDSYIDTYVDATGHAWGEWTVVTAPTCTEKGLDERFCSVCSERETRETDAPGHTWGEWTVVTAPTCTAKGLDERFCSVCSVRETRETDALEHDYVAVVTDPTCTEQGYTTHTCSRCNDSYIDTYVDATGHAWGEWTVVTAPTCTEKGLDERFCSVCSVRETRETDALEHDYVAVVTDPTCTEQGYTTHTCSRCNDSYIDTYVDATGHAWGEWTVVTAPTCTEKGLDERFCSVCSERETRETDAPGHTWGEWTVVTAPTCTAKGLDERFCSVCSVRETRETDALEHDYVAVVTDPTCTEQGYTTHTCSRCNDSYIDTYVDATGHAWGEWTVVTAPTCTEKGLDERFCSVCSVRETRETDALEHDYVAVVTDPTCTEQGYTTHTCSRCNDSYIDTYVDATGHAWGEWTVVTAPTCTEKGLDERFCSVCSERETRETDAPGHTWGEWTVVTAPTCTAKGLDERFCSVCSVRETRETDALEHDYVAVVTDPTCTEQGYTTHTCSRCNDSYIDTYVDATGHAWGEWTVVTAPTCTEKGLDERFCSVCSVRETRETDALEHDYVAVVTDPTCTEQGYTTHTCSRCNDSYIDTYVDATGHAWGEWTVVTAPTCTEKGLDERFCSVCSERETRETDALEHDYVAVVTDPTCTEQGYTTHTCSRCNDSYIDTYVDATGHAWGEWVVTDNPTYYKTGVHERECRRCHEVETETLPRLIDTTPPTGEITVKTDKWHEFLNTVTFGYFYNDSVTVTISASDDSAAPVTVSYYKSSEPLTLDQVKALTVWAAGSTFTATTNEAFVVYAKLQDEFGNVSYISTDGLVVDIIPPRLIGVESGTVYCSMIGIMVFDTYLDRVVIGETVHKATEQTMNIKLQPGSYDIRVYDKAGNLASVQGVTVYNGHISAGAATCTAPEVCVNCGAELAPEKGHTWGQWYVTVNATPTTHGEETRACSVCGALETRSTPIAYYPTSVTSSVYTVNQTSKLISSLGTETTVGQLLDNLSGSEYLYVYGKGGARVTDTSSVITTGMTVVLYNGTETVNTYTLAVTGDVDGDGRITINDVVTVQSHLLKKTTLTDAYFAAARVDTDANVTISDLTNILSHILKRSTITPRAY